MGFIIGLLTFFMVVNCVALVFLVLIQLPKKDAGAGLAFGGSASDALFGAGSGNVLTKITKYSAGIFFVVTVVLSVLQSHYHNRSTSAFQRALEQPARPPAGAVTPGPANTPSTSKAPGATPAAPLSSTNLLESKPETPAATPAAPTNAAPAK